jgi:hypothetical protein
MEADPVPETRSSYCFAAISVPGKLQLRRSYCYCENCTKKRYIESLFMHRHCSAPDDIEAVPKAFY